MLTRLQQWWYRNAEEIYWILGFMVASYVIS